MRFVTKLIDDLIENLISAGVFVFVATAKFYYSFIGSASSSSDKQDYEAFFELEKRVMKDVIDTSRAITKDDVDNEERLRRALHAQAVIDEAEKNLRAIYFRTPEELKRASACLLDFLQVTKNYCALTMKALSSGSSQDWDAAKSTYTQSMDTLGSFANELDNFALVMNNKADLLEASADETEELARKILKQNLKEKLDRHKRNP